MKRNPKAKNNPDPSNLGGCVFWSPNFFRFKSEVKGFDGMTSTTDNLQLTDLESPRLQLCHEVESRTDSSFDSEFEIIEPRRRTLMAPWPWFMIVSVSLAQLASSFTRELVDEKKARGSIIF